MGGAKPPKEWTRMFREHLTAGYLLVFLLIVAVIFIAGAVFWSTALF